MIVDKIISDDEIKLVEEGDFFIMNPHEYHCNSHILDEQNMDRLSIVTYCRARIISFLNI